jgi:hypothetical protein
MLEKRICKTCRRTIRKNEYAYNYPEGVWNCRKCRNENRKKEGVEKK